MPLAENDEVIETFLNGIKLSSKCLRRQFLPQDGAGLFHDGEFFGAAFADAGFEAAGAEWS